MDGWGRAQRAPRALGARCARPQPPLRKRGVRWVLQWAVALAVLTVATSVLVEFAYLLAAEQALNLAARTGATEATLPRATYRSVVAAVERRLASYPRMSGQLRLSVLQNGRPVGTGFRAGDGDRLLITLTAPRRWSCPAGYAILYRGATMRRSAPVRNAKCREGSCGEHHPSRRPNTVRRSRAPRFRSIRGRSRDRLRPDAGSDCG